VHQSKDVKFKIGKGIILRQGNDIALIATGSMLHNAKILTDILAAKGVDACLVSMHTIKPIDKELILKLVKKTMAIFTIEEPSLIGGLGSSVAEIIAESPFKDIYFERIALPDLYADSVGSQKYLHQRYKLLPDQMSERILKKIKNERRKKNKKRNPR
jgi:transketolase